MAIEYLKDKRIVYGLLEFEKTILEKLFIAKGIIEMNYQECKEFIRRSYRIPDKDAIEIIESLCKLKYMKIEGGKRNLTIKIIKDYWGDEINGKDKND